MAAKAKPKRARRKKKAPEPSERFEFSIGIKTTPLNCLYLELFSKQFALQHEPWWQGNVAGRARLQRRIEFLEQEIEGTELLMGLQ